MPFIVEQARNFNLYKRVTLEADAFLYPAVISSLKIDLESSRCIERGCYCDFVYVDFVWWAGWNAFSHENTLFLGV